MNQSIVSGCGNYIKSESLYRSGISPHNFVKDIDDICIERLFNEFYLFKSNKILLNNNKVSIFKISNTLKQNFKHKKLINTYLDKDRLIHYS